MFFSVRLKETLFTAVRFISALFFCVMLVMFPGASSDGAKRGLEYSLKLLIPSLFPFMLLSSYIVRSGLSVVIGRAFSPIMKFLFGLDGSAAAVVVMSFIGGFPVGARGIAAMYETGQLSLNQAKRMSLFCVGAGPAFLITAVGTTLLGNEELGIILFVSQLISGLVLGIISRFFYTGSPEFPEKKDGIKPPQKNSMNRRNAFTLSCKDASGGILSLSALVILFQSFMGILEGSGIESLISNLFRFMRSDFSEIILPSILEVTGACNLISQGSLPLWVLSAVIAFGGLCVHFQIWGILSDIRPSKPLFILFRIFAAILSGLCTYIITLFCTPSSEVFSSFSEAAVPDTAAHFTGGAMVLVLSVLFLISLPRGEGKRRIA